MYRHKFTAGALVVATGLFYLFLTGFQQSSSTHMTLQSLTEAAQKDGLNGERIQLGGSTVVPGSIQWDKYKSSAAFNITDGQRTMRVQYVGNAVRLVSKHRAFALVRQLGVRAQRPGRGRIRRRQRGQPALILGRLR